MVDCAFCQFVAGPETERFDDDSVLRNHTTTAPAVLTFAGSLTMVLSNLFCCRWCDMCAIFRAVDVAMSTKVQDVFERNPGSSLFMRFGLR